MWALGERECCCVGTFIGAKIDRNAAGEVAWVDFRSSAKITDVGLRYLNGLTNLEVLTLTNTKTTDAALVHLKGLTSLQTLILSYTAITDEGLVHFKGLTKLQRLVLGRTQVTDAGVAELKKALPNCRIVK